MTISLPAPLRLLLRALDPIALVSGAALGFWTAIKMVPLAWTLARRDLHARHKAQFLGVMWTIAHPVLLMSIFLFIFGVVFKARIENSFEMPRDYTMYILSGLVPWLACVPAFTMTTNSVVGSAGLVKQFHFDTTILPIRDVLTTVYFWVVGILMVLTYALLSGNGVGWSLALLPVALFFTFCFLIGLGWLLAAFSVFFKDIKEIMIVLVTILVYILPIVYLPQWTPEMFQGAIKVNPLSYLIWIYQDIFYFGRVAHERAWILFPILSLVTLSAGYRSFRRLKPYFGNAL